MSKIEKETGTYEHTHSYLLQGDWGESVESL